MSLKKHLTALFFLLLYSLVYGQENLKYYKFQTAIDETVEKEIFSALDSLFVQLTTDQFDDRYLSSELKDLTRGTLLKIKEYETRKDSVQKNQIDKHLISGYPLNQKEYFLSLAFIQKNKADNPILYYIINLIATKKEGQILFSIPLDYYTRDWKKTTVGSTIYHHKEELKQERAAVFDKKNAAIAQKLGVEKETFDFYMCENYQEILRLLGVEFSIYENSKYRTGYGVVANTIFSIMNNEDFSHDVFHYYSGKINERVNRNWITEEGIAYWWGNAYYTDPKGEMISHQQLVKALENYLIKHPETSLFSLFENSPKIFNQLAPEVSVRSTIAGIIAQQVEKEKGAKGIAQLINAGSQDRLQSFLKATDALIGINQENFNQKVKKLIKKNRPQ